MKWHQVRFVLLAAVAALMLYGCAAAKQQEPSQPVAAASPAQDHSAQQPPAQPQPEPAAAPSQPPPAPAQDAPSAKPAAPTPGAVKLVPLPEQPNIRVKMLHPEGSQVIATALGDGIQIFHENVFISVQTWQLRGEQPPATAEQAQKRAREWAPDATAKAIERPGTVAAYELQYSQQKTRSIRHHLYGTTYQVTVTCKAPEAEFAAWEPVFREMLASFKSSNLDAEPLPGRP